MGYPFERLKEETRHVLIAQELAPHDKHFDLRFAYYSGQYFSIASAARNSLGPDGFHNVAIANTYRHSIELSLKSIYITFKKLSLSSNRPHFFATFGNRQVWMISWRECKKIDKSKVDGSIADLGHNLRKITHSLKSDCDGIILESLTFMQNPNQFRVFRGQFLPLLRQIVQVDRTGTILRYPLENDESKLPSQSVDVSRPKEEILSSLSSRQFSYFELNGTIQDATFHDNSRVGSWISILEPAAILALDMACFALRYNRGHLWTTIP